MFSNKLKLNTDKTEFLILRSKYRANNISIKSLRVGNDIIDESKSAKNLGVHIDNELLFERHVISICKACYMQIAAIWKIRKCINEDTAKILVNALVVSKLDYCNGLLYGLPVYLIHKLQMVLNSAARLVTLTPKANHITPILRKLHW